MTDNVPDPDFFTKAVVGEKVLVTQRLGKQGFWSSTIKEIGDSWVIVQFSVVTQPVVLPRDYNLFRQINVARGGRRVAAPAAPSKLMAKDSKATGVLANLGQKQLHYAGGSYSSNFSTGGGRGGQSNQEIKKPTYPGAVGIPPSSSITARKIGADVKGGVGYSHDTKRRRVEGSEQRPPSDAGLAPASSSSTGSWIGASNYASASSSLSALSSAPTIDVGVMSTSAANEDCVNYQKRRDIALQIMSTLTARSGSDSDGLSSSIHNHIDI
jgi:hypothetical protein